MSEGSKRVAIVGAGLVGRAWAITFARAGCAVRLWDPGKGAAEGALAFVGSVAEDLARNDLLNGRTPDELLAAMTPCADLADALDGADWVQESGPENIEGKRESFARIDALAPPSAVLASSSSALLPSAIFEAVPGRARGIVAHPINPPYLVPAVEVVPSQWTTPEVMDRAVAFLRAAGQVPLRMEKEIAGFIMNRMQGALMEEAFRLVAGGYASAEDIDRSIADGLALRWSFMGPFETIDLNAPGGVADYVARYQPMYEDMFESMCTRVDWRTVTASAIEPSRRAAVATEALPERQRWRDRRLMALVAQKRRADRDIGR
ncbi:3-hydroxyacyl-CoA dehydrogenase [Pseudoxanthobacter soli DSM 19599]|uniref:3-hydroxyacyl-CoA dehydrogenase n=1 Tax=Pseudoxanthobacter soli DSM 19599 TaxID=1123029 RepID=A0A1M7ZLH7_9HYPH|nr:3-hydroxyacyl-CoA dehydrogenase [Pseudoxanthobacter soli]SHO65744.1 3-hydroxyacyl-CoA dehydrogenase [Pseudoxanthobacter soli DSM 19599]